MNRLSTREPHPQQRPHRALAIARGVLALAASGLTATAQAGNYTETQVSGNATGWVVTTVPDASTSTGTPGTVLLDRSIGEVHYAAASGQQQTLRALAAGDGAGGGGGNQIFTSSKFSWETQVLADSTHALGDAITVTLDLRMDGRLAAGFSPYFTHPPIVALPADYRLSTAATASSRFLVSDLDSGHYEGGAPDFRFDYRGGVHEDAGASTDPNFIYNYANTSVESLATANLQGGGHWNSNGNVAYTEGVGWGQSLDVDTGHVFFTFDTFVGNRLLLEGDMSTEADGFLAGLDWTALADFGNTFDAELSAPGGVQFADITSGVYSPEPEGGSAVPEPASPALVFAALGAALITTRRRRGRGRDAS